MSMKSSQALLAALALISGPAFAQEAAPEAQPGTPVAEQPAEGAQPAAPAPTDDTADQAPTGTTTPDTPADADEPADQPADQPAAAGEGAPAQEAAADERPGTYYPKSEHGDWTIRCIRAGQGKDPCEMYKLLTDEDDNAVAELTLIPLSNGNVAAGATLVAPLETDLIEGLGFRVDSGEMRGYPFSFCAPVGCVSRLGFTDAELNGMKRGNRATV
ncbi:MAG: invasion associated locus B family protein, partial [Alphaproteobacteria bacterium]|nr:invasion associated locus B family protein [Alphaproteobacteria bacterium]